MSTTRLHPDPRPSKARNRIRLVTLQAMREARGSLDYELARLYADPDVPPSSYEIRQALVLALDVAADRLESLANRIRRTL